MNGQDVVVPCCARMRCTFEIIHLSKMMSKALYTLTVSVTKESAVHLPLVNKVINCVLWPQDIDSHITERRTYPPSAKGPSSLLVVHMSQKTNKISISVSHFTLSVMVCETDLFFLKFLDFSVEVSLFSIVTRVFIRLKEFQMKNK